MRAIRAAHAFDGVRFLPGGATVLWDGERIVGVEPGSAPVPQGVEVTDHAGTVLPGLIDCHTHLVADGTIGGQATSLVTTDKNPHSIQIDASNRFVFVPNTGADKVLQFKYDAATGRITPVLTPGTTRVRCPLGALAHASG